MDRRHGKRPLPPEASEEKDKEVHDDFPSYSSSWSETDMSAMVSALSQVIGTTDDKPTAVQSTPLAIDQSVVVKEEPDPSQPLQDQGMCVRIGYVLVIFALPLLVILFHNYKPVYSLKFTVLLVSR